MNKASDIDNGILLVYKSTCAIFPDYQYSKISYILRGYEEIEGRCLSYSLKYAYCKYG